MLLSVLHIIAFVLIILVVIIYNIVRPGSETLKRDRITAALAVITVVLSFALFIYDKVVGI